MQSLLISKKYNRPHMQGVYSRGPYARKLNDSIKSITEHKDRLCITDIQSDKVLKKNNLSSDIVNPIRLSHIISTTNPYMVF